jgi:hypothetical protein
MKRCCRAASLFWFAAYIVLTVSPVAYAAGGDPLWTNRFNLLGAGKNKAYGLAVDQMDNIFVAGYAWNSNNWDIVTLKYSASGVLLWMNRLDGPSAAEYGQGLGLDANGNVFVTGASLQTNGWTDIVTIKYSNAGIPLWTNRYNGSFDGEDTPNDLGIDRNGDVYITAASAGTGGPDYLTLKYSNAGVPIWTNRYIGPGNSTDWPLKLAFDTNNNVFVTGSSVGSNTYYDIATIAYSSTGVPLWVNRYNGMAENSDDGGNSIRVDKEGNVFVAGYSTETLQNPDYIVLKYSNTGLPLRTNRFSGFGSDSVYGMDLDNDGNVLITGWLWTPANSFDYGTIKYSNSGVPLWTNLYNGPANANDYALKLVTDMGGNVFVTGYSDRGNSLGVGFATVAYSGTGVPIWTNRYDGPSNDNESTAIAVDSGGNVIVTGFSNTGTSDRSDFATIKYASSITLPIRLDFQKLNDQLILSWTNAAFKLQVAPAVSDTYSNIAGATSPYTNSLTGLQQFFRLKL